jgi:hypothetical protein
MDVSNALGNRWVIVEKKPPVGMYQERLTILVISGARPNGVVKPVIGRYTVQV